MAYIWISDPTVNIIHRWSKPDSITLSSECILFIILFLLYFQSWCYCCHDIFMSAHLTVLIFHMFVEHKKYKIRCNMLVVGCWLTQNITMLTNESQPEPESKPRQEYISMAWSQRPIWWIHSRSLDCYVSWTTVESVLFCFFF